MKNQENKYQVTVNDITYTIYETTKNGYQSVGVMGKMKFHHNGEVVWSNECGKSVQGERNEVLDFKTKVDEIIHEHFQSGEGALYKFQKDRLEKGLPMLGSL